MSKSSKKQEKDEAQISNDSKTECSMEEMVNVAGGAKKEKLKRPKVIPRGEWNRYSDQQKKVILMDSYYR